MKEADDFTLPKADEMEAFVIVSLKADMHMHRRTALSTLVGTGAPRCGSRRRRAICIPRFDDEKRGSKHRLG